MIINSFFHSFVAHTPGFDSLKSINISEGLTGLQWLPKMTSNNHLLTCNERFISLWKMGIKKLNKIKMGDNEDGTVSIPTIETYDKAPFSTIYKLYENGHPYSIHSISINSDGETFISSDDLTINLWNFENTRECFNIVNLMKPNIEDLNEVITCAQMHPTHCNIMMWGSSQGTIHLADLRESSLVKNSKVFQDNSQEDSFFSVITSSISSLKFSNNDDEIISRDYLNLKIWDKRKEQEPISTFGTQDYLRPKICDLYTSDAIFDKFGCSINSNDRFIVTGSYNDIFTLYNKKKEKISIIKRFPTQFRGKLHM